MTIDGALTAAPASVDPDALVAELFEREGRSLVRLARLFCDDRNAAEDLVQEAFIRLHRSAGSIRDLDRAPAFLRSIVLNLARDHNRRGLMSFRHRFAGESERTPAVDPGDHAVADDESAAVLAALRTLPERQRACLVLRYFEQLSVGEVADTLGISVNSVKTHCRRGLAALEQRLETRQEEST
jgi:RNA polymerase sigma-70 factor (sigma-E family)